MRWLALLPLLTVLLLLVAPGSREEPTRDEDVTLFPTAAHVSGDGARWVVPIHAWVHEPARASVVRHATTGLVRRVLGVPEDGPEAGLLAERLHWFLVDNRRGERPRVRVAGVEFALPGTAADGHAFGTVEIDRARADARARDGWLALEVVTPEDDARVFRGAALLVPPRGISVVSDIDDTVRVARVGDGDARGLARRTLAEPLVPVEGMAALYRSWMGHEGAAMHYVTAAPWQLEPVFADFLATEGFPRGTFHCKRFRLVDRTVLKLFEGATATKEAALARLFEQFPQRRFVLVGDTGEKDPEVYAGFARAWPERVLAVYLRDVTGETNASPRLGKLFEGFPAERWTTFTDPGDLHWPVG